MYFQIATAVCRKFPARGNFSINEYMSSKRGWRIGTFITDYVSHVLMPGDSDHFSCNGKSYFYESNLLQM